MKSYRNETCSYQCSKRETKNKDGYIILALTELRRQYAINLDRQVIIDLKEYLKWHKNYPYYIEDDISSILSYIKENDYSLEVTNRCII